jgi:hypothetical protein
VAKILQTKTPLDSPFFPQNFKKKGKKCKRVVNIFTIAYNMKGAQNFLISYFKYRQIWLNDLMDGILTTP